MSTLKNVPLPYRAASAEEQAFYQESLYPWQDEVFRSLTLYGPTIYLAGATALARFHFQHRFSDDLDFFTTEADLKPLATDLAGRLSQLPVTVEIDRLEVYFARFYLTGPALREARGLKIELVREFNRYGDLHLTEAGIWVDNLEDLGANKMTAFADRAEVKDVIDLYYLARRLTWAKLFEVADFKRLPVAYENLLAIHQTGLSGRVLLTEELPADLFWQFTAELTAQTEAEVKKKELVALENIGVIVHKLLWDFPPEDKILTTAATPVLRRRLAGLKLPEQRALRKVLATYDSTYHPQ